MTISAQEYLFYSNIIFAVFAFIGGACIGSFLNVVILRVPKGLSVVKPPSTCVCKKRIKPYDNIPILSWFILRGKARCCGAKISFRYPFIELLTALLFLACYLLLDSPVSYVMMFFTALMIVVSFIDIDTLELPDFLTAGGALIGFILSVAIPQIHDADIENAPFLLSAFKSGISSFAGITVGVGLCYVIRYIGEVVFNREAMGEGDVILMGLIGAFCGWQGAVFAILGGSFFGSILILPLIPILKRQKKDLMIAFGPVLALGALLYVLVFKDFVANYVENVQRIFQL
ncbi:MAG: prepilin peptidase [Opitutales bacterium]